MARKKLQHEIAEIRADATLSPDERIWTALDHIARRFDAKVRSDDDDDFLGALFGDL